MQNILMKFDPATGEERPYPSHAAQWREWHGGTAWLFDPWTGRRRDARDVGSDVHGLLIVPAGTLGGDAGGGASKQNKHEAGSDAQWPEPVGWMTPGGDISRSLKWCTDRCLPNDYRLEALYTRAQVEVMVCAQEARRVEMLRKLGARLAGLLDEDQFAECEALLLAAGVMPEEKDNVACA